MEQVYKKFRKGEVYNSLRDLLPALTGRMFRQQSLGDKDKREFWALQDISFEVKRGESLGIVGPNGAGKSTILKILSRIMEPSRGSMHVNGRLSALIEVGAGFHQDLTGRENIYLNGTILGMTKREIDSKMDQIIDFSGIEEFIDTPVKRYSSGMFARLGFAVAAHVDPDVLIVDEVLSVGDFVFQQKCMDRMRSVLERGTTVLFVSHNVKAVTELCARSLLLRHGKMAMLGSTDEVIRNYLTEAREQGAIVTKKSVYISQVKVRGSSGEQSTFESGERAYLDVEVRARNSVEKLAVVVWLTDEKEYELFNTSTQRLGHPTFSLQPGESYHCTFELTLNIAHGTFNVCVAVHRYDLDKTLDRQLSAVTLFIGSTTSVRGAVNCFPRLLEAGTEVDEATRLEAEV
jgi:ABC-type polysaccharide/polyol phosphate transport system ATPase subunit